MSEAIKISNEMETTPDHWAVFETAPLGILVCDEKWEIENVNRAFGEICGKTVSNLIGTEFIKVIPFQFQMELELCFETLQNQGKYGPSELGVISNVDHARNVLVNAMKISDKKNGDKFWFFVEDITDRKRYEREIFETNILMNAILDSTNYCVMSIDQNGIIKTFNRGAERLLGYKAEELIGSKKIEILFFENELKKKSVALTKELKIGIKSGVDTLIARTKISGKPDECEFQFRTKQGLCIPIFMSITAFRDQDGNITGYVVVSYDLTEQKKLQNALEGEKAKAFQSSKMISLGEMATGIAHEINNPLAIIIAKCDMIVRQADKGVVSAETLSADLKKVVDTSFRISKIVEGLKSFARDAGNDPFTEAMIKEVIEDTADLFRQRMRSKNVSFTVECLTDSKISCRPAQIAQVIINLLNNSMDAMSALQEKWVSVKCVEIKGKAMVEVVDSGKGIRKEIAAKIFQPFFTTKDIGKGQGLGLSISLGIIEEHKGRLYLDEKFSNTRFVFELPSIK